MSRDGKPVLVAGGGWAGLSAAVHLAARGVPVHLVEAARQLGGRARRVRLGELAVDNGQHLLIGAYHATLDLLEQIGVPGEALLRTPLQLDVLAGPRHALQLRAPRLPAPFHLLLALWRARGLTRHDRRRALAFGRFLQGRRGELADDDSVAELLRAQGQTPATVRLLWEPLCLATLNTPLARASARVFARVLYDALFRARRDSDLLFARRDLGALLPDPAMAFIEHHGGRITLGRRVTGLRIARNRLQAVEMDGETIDAPRAILAVSPEQCLALCRHHAPLSALADGLARLDSQPICTVYLQYPQATRLPRPAIGMVGGLCQWLFDRRHAGQAGLMAAVISAEGPHMAMDNAELGEAVGAEIARAHPHWPAPHAVRVIREKRATFACVRGSDTLRPASATPVRGLYLAGDFTATGYPATLEGAVRSGRVAARHILENLQEDTP